MENPDGRFVKHRIIVVLNKDETLSLTYSVNIPHLSQVETFSKAFHSSCSAYSLSGDSSFLRYKRDTLPACINLSQLALSQSVAVSSYSLPPPLSLTTALVPVGRLEATI